MNKSIIQTACHRPPQNIDTFDHLLQNLRDSSLNIMQRQLTGNHGDHLRHCFRRPFEYCVVKGRYALKTTVEITVTHCMVKKNASRAIQ